MFEIFVSFHRALAFSLLAVNKREASSDALKGWFAYLA
jgi:hypothetical protein